MKELDYAAAAILGVVQGLTEFLPISSSAHLALAQDRLGLSPDSPVILLFDGFMHIGTVLSMVIVFASPIRKYALRLMRESIMPWSGRRYAWRIALLGIAASIPTAAIGLGFRDNFEKAFAQPRRVALGLLITGVLLAATTWLQRGRRGWRRFAWWQAVLVGFAQGVAIEPGISRSGATICMASFCGLRRRWAAEFSFFIAMPAIVGATLLQFRKTLNLPADSLGTVAWGPMMAGSLLSLIVGVLALKLLMGMVRRAKLHYFAAYCWLLGGWILLRG